MSMVALQQAARTNSREAYKMYTEVRRAGGRERRSKYINHLRMPSQFSVHLLTFPSLPPSPILPL